MAAYQKYRVGGSETWYIYIYIYIYIEWDSCQNKSTHLMSILVLFLSKRNQPEKNSGCPEQKGVSETDLFGRNRFFEEECLSNSSNFKRGLSPANPKCTCRPITNVHSRLFEIYMPAYPNHTGRPIKNKELRAMKNEIPYEGWNSCRNKSNHIW